MKVLDGRPGAILVLELHKPIAVLQINTFDWPVLLEQLLNLLLRALVRVKMSYEHTRAHIGEVPAIGAVVRVHLPVARATTAAPPTFARTRARSRALVFVLSVVRVAAAAAALEPVAEHVLGFPVG